MAGLEYEVQRAEGEQTVYILVESTPLENGLSNKWTATRQNEEKPRHDSPGTVKFMNPQRQTWKYPRRPILGPQTGNQNEPGPTQ
ncbi:hypothetical protein N7457_007379 [Penicillium paradoxum]|uniref:uncharacterized protein n=1 Tax=Penicillium paradoxum TaxID=176176 RepID=UPI002548F34F|nr:uncharacterized protein N7457_007379 [Penicillium paradoxum]KAJ5779659.1 hypothetical protein N7457_007379 [Penicillium paradoxum]